jgi:hypothetical protein
MDTSEMICYDIRSLFQESPQLRVCPRCCTSLKRKNVGDSASGQAFRESATIPIVETTIYACEQCGWWAVREVRIDCELCDGTADQIVLARDWLSQGRIGPMTEILDSSPVPWERVIHDPVYWEDCQPLSTRVASFLFGKQEIEQKQDSAS